MNYSLVDILHTAGQAIRIPCNVALILLMIISVVQVGHGSWRAVLKYVTGN